MKNKALFVTIADENYLEQAKQLFSSAYWNGGWKGDYMLLAFEVPESKLKWFRDKGILIKQCKRIFKDMNRRQSIFFTKFYLFTKQFKKWDSIIYTDADVIIRANFDALCSLKGFWGVRDLSGTLEQQLKNMDAWKKRALKFDLNHPAFAAGFFVFDKEVIKEDTFEKLKKALKKILPISRFDDQLTLNLFFYNWKELPSIYNVFITDEQNKWFLPPDKIYGIMLHFPSEKKPWVTMNYFYKEWKENYEKADLIDLKREVKGRVWNKSQIVRYSRYLERRRKMAESYLFFDRFAGRIGINVRKLSPRIYFALKKTRACRFFESFLSRS